MTSAVTATFVFTDLVDSTATAARLGPAAAEELRQTHFRLLRGAVSASAGVEVKNLGDGLMVMYSSPSRALVGAVGMQQAIDHHNRSDGEQLGVRVGISTGEAVEENGDYFGDPVVEAARLCAKAEAAQILAADVVRILVGRHATQTFVEVGALELKGIPDPVDVVEVLWEPAKVEGSIPLPGRLVGAASDALFGFFGRGPELAALEDVRKRTHESRRCQVVFVAGEAGLGKTALAAQVARAAHEQGASVLFGHADEDLGVAYQPWIEALSALVRDVDSAVIEGLPSAQQAALARLFPSLSGSGARVADPDTERLLLLQGSAELLAAASRDVPVLVVLDDLHWADAASLQLLRHLTAAVTPMDLMVVCTYRDTDLARGNPLNKLLADLYREASVTRLSLKGLEDTEVIELMEAAAGHTLDDNGIGLAHALRRETDGNPFFTGEILRHLGETGGIVLGDDGRWTVAGESDLRLPNSVRDVIGQRVERLGDETHRVLSLASVCGREFPVVTLATLADIDEDTLLDLLDAAVAAALLVETDDGSRYRFAHALIQHSLYDDLSPARRQRVHQRIAAALETDTTPTDPALLAELARHWIAATRPADLDKALRYARLAGDAARNALAPDDAIRWYQQALDLLARQSPPDEHRRAELLAVLGTVQSQAAKPEYHDTLLQAAALAEQLDDTDILVQAALGFTVNEIVGDDARKPIIRAALNRIGTEATADRARLLVALAFAHDASLEWQTRRDLSVEAIETARGAGDDATFVHVIDLVSRTTLATPDRRDELINDVEAAVTVADRIGDPLQRARIRRLQLWARHERADIAGADDVLAEIEALTETIGLPVERAQHAQIVTGQLLLAGQADQAETTNERALELGTAAGVPERLAVYGSFLKGIREHQGRLDEIADAFIEAARANPSLAALRSAVIPLLSVVGRIDEAREQLAAETAAGFDYPYDGTWLATMANLLDAASTVQDHAAARTLVERVTPFAGHVIALSGVKVNGAIARPLGRAATVLGDYDQAEQWFAIAHDIHTRLQAPYWLAMGQLDHADLCLARRAEGDTERARELAATAAAAAAEYGCAGQSKRAENLLADLRPAP
jgi:class 3 adenylate cyclase/tetratricopeptide (TPR) repeat protein